MTPLAASEVPPNRLKRALARRILGQCLAGGWVYAADQGKMYSAWRLTMGRNQIM